MFRCSVTEGFGTGDQTFYLVSMFERKITRCTMILQERH